MTTSSDPILAEIRALREAQAAKFHYDGDELFADLQRREEESGREFVSRPPKLLKPRGSVVAKSD